MRLLDSSRATAHDLLSAQRISIGYLGHATTLLEIDGVRILTDPLLRRRTAHLRRSAIPQRGRYLSNLDAVIISHMHWDHMDLPSLRMLPSKTPVFAPWGAGEVLERAGLRDVTEVTPGDRSSVGSIQLEATPANHDGSRPPFGPVGEAVGFLLHGSVSIYFAGDTDLFDEMSAIGKHLDVALLPVWGWGPTLGSGHLDPGTAATALTLLQPRYAVPIHWGTLCPIGLRWTRPSFLTTPPRDFVHEAYRQAPEVAVRVVQPGGRLSLTSTLS